MWKNNGRPRDSKGIFIQSKKSFSKLFGPVKTPPTDPANHYRSIREEGERSTSKVESENGTLYQK